MSTRAPQKSLPQVAGLMEYKPNFGGAAAILQAAANVIAVAERERLERFITHTDGSAEYESWLVYVRAAASLSTEGKTP